MYEYVTFDTLIYTDCKTSDVEIFSKKNPVRRLGQRGRRRSCTLIAGITFFFFCHYSRCIGEFYLTRIVQTITNSGVVRVTDFGTRTFYHRGLTRPRTKKTRSAKTRSREWPAATVTIPQRACEVVARRRRAVGSITGSKRVRRSARISALIVCDR